MCGLQGLVPSSLPRSTLICCGVLAPARPTLVARRSRLIITAQSAATQPKMQSAHDIGGSIVGKVSTALCQHMLAQHVCISCILCSTSAPHCSKSYCTEWPPKQNSHSHVTHNNLLLPPRAILHLQRCTVPAPALAPSGLSQPQQSNLKASNCCRLQLDTLRSILGDRPRQIAGLT